MAEMTGTTTTPVSDVMLARYVAGDLRGEQLARVERALGETPGLAERLERMKSERAAFLATTPPQQFAHHVATRLTVERPAQPKWQIWWLLPPVTVATALLFGVVYQRALGPQSLSRPAVATDETFELPEDAKPVAAAPGAAEPEPQLADKAAEAKAPARELPAKPESPVASDPAATGGGGGAANLARVESAKQSSERREDRERARKKDAAPLGGLGSEGLGQQAFGIGRGGDGAASGKGGYAQPPPSTQSAPAPAQSASPPVWAAPPPPAPAPQELERRSQAADSSAGESADRDVVAKTPAPRKAEPSPSAAAAGPVADTANKAVKESVALKPADEKAKKAPAAARGASVAEDDAAAEVVAVSVGVTREVGGRARSVAAGDVVPSASLLKVTAQGGRYVTVVGVRRDAVVHVYGQTESSSSQAVVVPVRLRPASSRISEALFVIVGDAPLGKVEVSAGKDAAQLPLRLAVPGTQRRFVLTVSASAD